MEILEIVVRAPAAGFSVQHLVRRADGGAARRPREDPEEEPRAVDIVNSEPSWSAAERIRPRHDVGEILLDQRRSVGVQALLEAEIGPGAWLRPAVMLPLPAPQAGV